MARTRTARGTIKAKPDDSHTNLGWNDVIGGLTTHPLPGGMRLGLSFATLTLMLIDAKDANRGSMPLLGATDSDTRAWLGEQMQAVGLDPRALDAPLPWEMPAHPIASGSKYGSCNADARAELAAWFANADGSLNRIRGEHASNQRDATPVRCWPHHFDIATLIMLEGGDPEHARSVNAGLSPGDGSYDEPYFYVSPWPYPDAAKLTPLAAPGHWHTQGFLAAIAPASAILAAAAPQQAAEDFLQAAVAAVTKTLS